jgi:prolipoprotein diacylglyceryltransferase
LFPNLSIGPVSLPVPPLLIIIGFWLGITITEQKTKQSSIDPDFAEKLLWVILLSGVIGARLSFIANNLQAFKGNMVSIVSINPNLFDSTGGILIAIAVGFLIISKNKIPGWKLLDLLTPFFIILLISIGLSKFASGDGFGINTDMPWGIPLWGEKRHPVQLYYVVVNIIISLITIKNFPIKSSAPGNTFLLFSILTSCSYLFISGFQKIQLNTIYGLHLNKIALWLILALSLAIYWIRTNPEVAEDEKYA